MNSRAAMADIMAEDEGTLNGTQTVRNAGYHCRPAIFSSNGVHAFRRTTTR